MEKETKSLFEKLYGVTEEARKLLKKPLVKSKLSRRLHASYDDCEEKKIENTVEITKLEENLEEFDINSFLQKKNNILMLERQQDWIKEEYKKMFGKEMKILEQED